MLRLNRALVSFQILPLLICKIHTRAQHIMVTSLSKWSETNIKKHSNDRLVECVCPCSMQTWRHLFQNTKVPRKIKFSRIFSSINLFLDRFLQILWGSWIDSSDSAHFFVRSGPRKICGSIILGRHQVGGLNHPSIHPTLNDYHIGFYNKCGLRLGRLMHQFWVRYHRLLLISY